MGHPDLRPQADRIRLSRANTRDWPAIAAIAPSTYRRPNARPIKVTDLNKTLLGVSTNCVTCHQDQHKGRLGENCLQCHTYNDWKTVSVGKFDHSKTRYPLTGPHAQVTCEKCHTPGPDSKPRYTGIAFGKCSDCHSDPHRGSFAQGCQACHNTSGWKTGFCKRGQSAFRSLDNQVPVAGQACHGGMFTMPCGRGFQEAAGLSKVHGLPQA